MPKTLYGPQTKKAVQNFPISFWPMPCEFICTLALIKQRCAEINGALKQIPKGHAQKITRAAKKIVDGQHLDQFPVDVFQTGSGTSTNMNMNEVLAALAGQGVHPNDHVNCGQSSNDVMPTAMNLSCALAVREQLLPSLEVLEKALKAKAKQFRVVVKTGRTHLMDAVPVRLGDEFGSYAALVAQGTARMQQAQKLLCALPLGGTGVGTGLGAHPQFARRVIAKLAKDTKLALKEAPNHLAAQSCPMAAQALSSALKELAIALSKIANDIRLMGSGPQAGLNELVLPDLQAGSSIMPGKVNPVLCESVEQVVAWIVGADATVTHSLVQGSRLELHTCTPMVACKLLTSIMLLTNVSTVFAQKCVKGIQANKKTIKEKLSRNAMLVTALAKEIGYDAAAAIAQEAMRTGETIFAVASRRSGISSAKLKKLLDPKKMV